MSQCDATFDLKINVFPGLYTGSRGGVRGMYPPSWANYLKIIQFFTRNWLYTPNFGLKIRIFLRFAPPFVKTLKIQPPFQTIWYMKVILEILDQNDTKIYFIKCTVGHCPIFHGPVILLNLSLDKILVVWQIVCRLTNLTVCETTNLHLILTRTAYSTISAS